MDEAKDIRKSVNGCEREGSQQGFKVRRTFHLEQPKREARQEEPLVTLLPSEFILFSSFASPPLLTCTLSLLFFLHFPLSHFLLVATISTSATIQQVARRGQHSHRTPSSLLSFSPLTHTLSPKLLMRSNNFHSAQFLK